MTENNLEPGNIILHKGLIKVVYSVISSSEKTIIELVDRTVDLNEIEPLEVTADILLSVGFDKKVDSVLLEDDYVSKDGTIRITGSITTNRPSPYDWYVNVDNSHFESIGGLDFAYVHEIQNFLKICGRKDISDSFKVLHIWKD